MTMLQLLIRCHVPRCPLWAFFLYRLTSYLPNTGIFYSELAKFSLQEGYIPKKCPETSKITGLIHKSLITCNLYKIY